MHEVIEAILRADGNPRRVPPVELAQLRVFFSDIFYANIDKFRVHPLGFFFFRCEASHLQTFRLHLWPTGSELPASQIDSDIHDHIFELNSVILSGQLQHETFSFLPNSEGDFQIANVKYIETKSLVNLDETFGNLQITDDMLFAEGDVYRLQPGTIHRARAMTLPTTTLVLAVTPPSPPAPRIVIKRGGAIPAEFDRRLLNEREAILAQKAIASFSK